MNGKNTSCQWQYNTYNVSSIIIQSMKDSNVEKYDYKFKEYYENGKNSKEVSRMSKDKGQTKSEI